MFNLNYGEYVFQQLVTTEFVQRKLAYILISLAANLINIHLVSILCLIVSVNPYVDFILQIGISVGLALKISVVYNFVERYEAEFYTLTQYLINNYSVENYRYWKRITVVTACLYACLLLLFVQITNWLLFLYIVQYVICFLIIEQFEQQRVQNWIKDYQERPTTKRLINDAASDFLINSYMSPRTNVLRPQRRVVPTRDQPVVRVREGTHLISPECSGSISSGPVASNSRYTLRKRR